MLHHAAIRVTLEALALARSHHWLPAAPDEAGFVVTLHHVRPATASSFSPNALLSVTPQFLDEFIRHFKGSGWQFVSAGELLSPLGEEGSRRIAITLDDGYRDNAEHAWPIFRRHQVPFTIYVCPGFSERTAELWWEALERIIAGTDSLSLKGEGPAEALPTRTAGEKRRVFQLWTAWLTTEADELRQRRVVRALAEKHNVDLARLADELVMNWPEIRSIADDPLAAIGAHTMTHPALARLPEREALQQMMESADRIEAEIGRRPTTLAFPYGYRSAAGEREAELAERAGFAGSFTTRPGYIPATGNRHGLPRISLNGLFQECRYYDVLLSSGIWRLGDRISTTPPRRPAGALASN